MSAACSFRCGGQCAEPQQVCADCLIVALDVSPRGAFDQNLVSESREVTENKDAIGVGRRLGIAVCVEQGSQDIAGEQARKGPQPQFRAMSKPQTCPRSCWRY